MRATFSKSITNQAGPLLELHYGRWTRLAPDLALPENAQVDWLNGVARAPAAWDLQLNPDSIRAQCTYGAVSISGLVSRCRAHLRGKVCSRAVRRALLFGE